MTIFTLYSDILKATTYSGLYGCHCLYEMLLREI
ncbi:hypothetical protein [Shigella phage ESh3]|nr:hypothetical protein [Shigella phage ESh3]